MTVIAFAVADVREQQPQPHPTLRQPLVLVGRFDLGMVVAVVVGMLLVPELMRDLLRLDLDQARRQLEAQPLVERVHQPPLQDRPGRAGVFRREPRP